MNAVTRPVAPPRPVYVPGVCAAPRTRDQLNERCGKPARLYPCGWRCDGCAPGAGKSKETAV